MKPDPRRRLAPDTDIMAYLRTLPLAWRVQAIALLAAPERDAIDRHWPGWAHDGQRPPDQLPGGGDWSSWVLMAGRGFGKTLAGAQWITAAIAAHDGAGAAPLRIALVGATLEDARRVMVEGRSGLLEIAGVWVTEWKPSLRRLRFGRRAEATLFSGASPALLRGPEHHLAWCDELAKWEKPQESWDMLQLGLRLGAHPRALVTTTPRPGPVLRAIMADPATVTTGGPTRANPHLPGSFKARVESLYAGTRLGRQELDGELLADAAGALWTVALIERCRFISPSPSGSTEARDSVEGEGVGAPPHGEHYPAQSRPTPTLQQSHAPLLNLKGRGSFTHALIAVDPPSGDGTCGIIACARSGAGAGAIAHVLADHSVTARSPEGWARAVADAAMIHGSADGQPALVVAEQNQGGKMVRAVLHTANPALRIKLVTATRGKSARAEPVAHLFEAGKVILHGRFPALEAQLLGLIAGGGYEGPGTSPDRADAMVWGVTELMLGRRGEPRVRVG